MFSQAMAFVAIVDVDMKGELIKMVVSLGVIVALAVFVGWWLKRGGRIRLGRFNASSKIKVLEKRPLSQKSALYLIEVGGKRLLVGDSPQGPRAISEMEAEKQISSPFEKLLEEKTIEK